MQSRRKKRKPPIEIFELAQSPFARTMTKGNLCRMLGTPLTTLLGLIKYKDAFVRRRIETSSGKPRPLAYPEAQLRRVNEKLAYQLRKIRLAPYVTSPRKGVGPRENAQRHVGATQFLKIDIKQFYPSITREQIAKYFREECGMYVNVAGMLTELLTVDGRIAYGAPATPALAALVHRSMFDEIYDAVSAMGLVMTLWVDDLTISGDKVPGALLEQIRAIVASHGFRTHKIAFRHSNRPVVVTGMGVRRDEVIPPNSLNLRIKALERRLHLEKSDDEYIVIANQLLSALGSQRYIRSGNDVARRRIIDRMHVIRQKRDKRARKSVSVAV